MYSGTGIIFVFYSFLYHTYELNAAFIKSFNRERYLRTLTLAEIGESRFMDKSLSLMKTRYDITFGQHMEVLKTLNRFVFICILENSDFFQFQCFNRQFFFLICLFIRYYSMTHVHTLHFDCFSKHSIFTAYTIIARDSCRSCKLPDKQICSYIDHIVASDLTCCV